MQTDLDGSLGSPDRPSIHQPSDPPEVSLSDIHELLQMAVAFLISHKSNLTALALRFIQLSRRPGDLAPLILDFWPMLPSFAWTGREPGLDLLYPLSSLKKQKSGRLARLLLEHSRDLGERDIHAASSPRDGIDLPHVTVIDLDEVPPEIIERGYAVPADVYGFVVMGLFLEVLITLLLLLYYPFDPSFYFKSLGEWMSTLYGSWVCVWYGFLAGIFSIVAIQLMLCFNVIIILCLYAVSHGEGTLTLIRRSDTSTPGCAVLLDRNFVVVLTGTQNVVEAIAESRFSIPGPFSREYRAEVSWLVQYLLNDALRIACQGLPFVVLVVLWLLLVRPTTFQMAYAPVCILGPVWVARLLTEVVRIAIREATPELTPDDLFYIPSRIVMILLVDMTPTFLLLMAYDFAVIKGPVIQGVLQPSLFMLYLHFIPPMLIVVHFVSSQNYHIRPAKLLDVLGHPPIRTWEFDTLAAAATFQCLVLCRGIPRPVQTIDVFNLLDIFIPDERDIWKVWKARVADRIVHEVDISFAPTLPSFRDEEQQKHLKDLLDQAQEAYDAYANFYNSHVPECSGSGTSTQEAQIQLDPGWDDSYWGTIRAFIHLFQQGLISF